MPFAPPKPCPVCGRLRCEAHQVEPWRTRHAPPAPRIRGRQLQRLRAELFARHPWCARCGTARSVIRDHIVNLAEGGQDVPENTQGLCKTCSDIKTREEAKRGIRRARG